MTSFAVNYGWTPELIAKDKALKEKYGAGAHIIPAKTYVGLERMPETDMFSLNKPKEKTSTTKKALIGVGTLALAIFALKKATPMIKTLLSSSKNKSHHAPQVVTEAERKLAQSAQEAIEKMGLKGKNLNKYKVDMPEEIVISSRYVKRNGFHVEQKVVKNVKTGKKRMTSEAFGNDLAAKPLKTHKIVDGKKVTEIKGKNGIIDSYTTEFNKQTGIITRKHSDGRVIQFNNKGDRIQYTLDSNGKIADNPVWVQYKFGSDDLHRLANDRLSCFYTYDRATNVHSFLMAPENFQKAIKDFNLPFKM